MDFFYSFPCLTIKTIKKPVPVSQCYFLIQNIIRKFRTKIDKPRISRYNRNNKKEGKQQGIRKMKSFNFPDILESLKIDVIHGKITISQAAEELYNAGWMNYIDEEKTKVLLKII